MINPWSFLKRRQMRRLVLTACLAAAVPIGLIADERPEGQNGGVVQLESPDDYHAAIPHGAPVVDIPFQLEVNGVKLDFTQSFAQADGRVFPFPPFAVLDISVRTARSPQWRPIFDQSGDVSIDPNDQEVWVRVRVKDIFKDKDARQSVLDRLLTHKETNGQKIVHPKVRKEHFARLIVQDPFNEGKEHELGKYRFTQGTRYRHSLIFAVPAADLHLLAQSGRDFIEVEFESEYPADFSIDDFRVHVSVAQQGLFELINGIASQPGGPGVLFVPSVGGRLNASTKVSEIVAHDVVVRVEEREGADIDRGLLHDIVISELNSAMRTVELSQLKLETRVTFLLENGLAATTSLSELNSVSKLNEEERENFLRKEFETATRNQFGAAVDSSVAVPGLNVIGGLSGNYEELSDEQKRDLFEQFTKDIGRAQEIVTGRIQKIVAMDVAQAQKITSKETFGKRVDHSTYRIGRKPIQQTFTFQVAEERVQPPAPPLPAPAMKEGWHISGLGGWLVQIQKGPNGSYRMVKPNGETAHTSVDEDGAFRVFGKSGQVHRDHVSVDGTLWLRAAPAAHTTFLAHDDATKVCVVYATKDGLVLQDENGRKATAKFDHPGSRSFEAYGFKATIETLKDGVQTIRWPNGVWVRRG